MLGEDAKVGMLSLRNRPAERKRYKIGSEPGFSLEKPGSVLVPLGVENIPRFYRGKKNSFSMRLPEGKQIP